jgi:hypothetical protein
MSDDRRTVASAHSRVDALEKEIVELKTTMKIQLKDLFGRVKLIQNIILSASGAMILMLVSILMKMSA